MGRDGAGFVLDLVGSDQTLALGAAASANQGRVVCVGAALGSFSFSLISQPWECVFQTSYSGEATELEQLVALAATGRVEVTADHITLDEVPAAYEQLDRGAHGVGRIIAVP